MDNVDHVEQVILLIHGIRTQADWQPMLTQVLEEKGRIKVISIKYGYFDVFHFWFPFARQSPVTRVEKEFRSARKKYPHAKISVIAHSFGTYVIGKLLKEEFDFELERLILCGSILPCSYPWEDVMHKFIGGNDENILNIVNECGKRDIWPVLAKTTSWGYGDSGTHGFGQGEVRDRYHNIQHSDYFTEYFATTYWKPFIKNGEYKQSESTPLATPWWLSVLGILPLQWIGILFLGLIILSTGLICKIYKPSSCCTITEMSCDNHPFAPSGIYRGQNRRSVLLIKSSTSQEFFGTDNAEGLDASYFTKGFFIGHRSAPVPLDDRTFRSEDYPTPGREGACSLLSNTFKVETTRIDLRDGCTSILYKTIIFTHGGDRAEIVDNGSDGRCNIPTYPTEEQRRQTIVLLKSHK